jgi:predicted lipid-binding transport protein (Tim44 family)
MPIDVIIYAIVALVLVLALRHVLGTRSSDEPSRTNPFLGPPLEPKAKAGVTSAPSKQPGGNPAITLPKSVSVAAAAQIGLATIAKADNNFDLAHFAMGAQDAFVAIVEAFAKGDRVALRDLLSDAVFQAFATVMDRRDQAGESASAEILSIRRVEIISASLAQRLATITIRFVADETLFVRDRDGKVIEGNPDRVSEIIDIWTFTREINSSSQIWRVTATREADAPSRAPDATPPAAG